MARQARGKRSLQHKRRHQKARQAQRQKQRRPAAPVVAQDIFAKKVTTNTKEESDDAQSTNPVRQPAGATRKRPAIRAPADESQTHKRRKTAAAEQATQTAPPKPAAQEQPKAIPPKPAQPSLPSITTLVVPSNDKTMTKYIAIDCEMVGVGPRGLRSVLAQVSIVNWYGNVVFTSYAKPDEEVTDYRTQYSGIRPENLVRAPTVAQVQRKVKELVKGHVIVGHALKNDFDVLGLVISHNAKLESETNRMAIMPWMIRDTAQYQPFLGPNGNPHKLKTLVRKILGVAIQTGEHCPHEDALSALWLFRHVKKRWEAQIMREYASFIKHHNKKS